MKGRALVVFVSFFITSLTVVYGQWDAQVSQYWRIKNFYNPSYVAETNNIENVLLHRQQWVGAQNSDRSANTPVTSLASFNMTFEFLEKKHGFGFLMNNDKLGLFSNTTTTLQYAYQFKFKKRRYLNVGLQGAMANINFDASGIFIPNGDGFDQGDEAIPTGKGGKTLDAGLGASWVTPTYYVALSVNHLWDPKVDIDQKHTAKIARAYYLMGGYNIKLGSPLIEFQPSAFLKYDAVAPPQLDVTAKMEYNKMFSGGVSWRKGDAVVVLLGVRIKNIEAGYAYDISTSEIAKVSGGSHELFLRYTIPIERKKVVAGQKSVRIL